MLNGFRRHVAVVVLVVPGLFGCSATQVTTRWQDPTATDVRFTKVLSLCFTRDPSLREAAEGELCSHVSSVECKPAAYAIPDSMLSDTEQAKALVRKEGFDGALVVRIVDARERVTYVSPTYEPTFWGYYGWAGPIAYDPGIVRTDQVVVVEVSIFSVTRDRLLWVGTSEILNPTSLPDVMDDLADAVRRELLRRNLLPPS